MCIIISSRLNKLRLPHIAAVCGLKVEHHTFCLKFKMSWFYPEVHGLTSSDSWWTSKSYNLTSEPPFFVSSTLMFVGIPSLKRWFWQPTPAAPWLLLFSRRGVACTASSSMRCLYCLVEYCWSIRHKCIQMHCDYISREYIILIGGFGTFYIFPYIGNDNPNWLSYFSEG